MSKTFGEMTPQERREVRERVIARLQRELQAAAPAIAKILEEDTVDSARVLGAQHGSEDTAPFGDLDDAGSGDLMTALGETGETTEDNYGYRVDLLNAYREAWEKAAGRFYPIGG